MGLRSPVKGLNALKGVASDGRDVCGGEARLTWYGAFQLRSDSTGSSPAVQLALLFQNSCNTHVFPLTRAIWAPGTVSKSARLLCWQGCRGGGEGHVKPLELGKFLPASNSPVPAPGFPQLCVFTCYHVHEVQRQRVPASQDSRPRKWGPRM